MFKQKNANIKLYGLDTNKYLVLGHHNLEQVTLNRGYRPIS